LFSYKNDLKPRNMSNTKKTVKVKESALVELIENIVNKEVASQKKIWLQEQTTKKDTILEGKIARLEAQFKALTATKK
jgi:4-hydroxy-3-methylbut-2-enyl diphosphate reductase IspH